MKLVMSVLRSRTWMGLLIVDIALVIGLSLTNPEFLSKFNIVVLLQTLAVVLLVSFSQMIVLGMGHMNLSVGSVGGLAAVMLGVSMARLGLPTGVAVLLAILVSLACGVFNGLLVVFTKINSFIVTLATSIIFLGFNIGISGGIPEHNLTEDFVAFGSARVSVFPYMLFVTAAITLGVAVFLYRMVAGRQLLAIGGNAKAAELSGLPVSRSIVLVHALSCGLAGVAGVLLTARVGVAIAVFGQDWALLSFAGPIMGGAALTGGSVSIVGCIIAVILVALIDNGLVVIGADPYWVQFFLGLLILIGVVLGKVSSKEGATRGLIHDTANGRRKASAALAVAQDKSAAR